MSQPSMQKLQDDLRMLVMKIKEHKKNIKSLKTQHNKLDDSILDLQVKYPTSSTPEIEHENNSQLQTEEQTIEQILQHEESAAGILCQLKTPFGTQASHLPLTKDVLGIVATLGKVDDDNLSRLFAEYLGVETMLAIVCKTYEGVKALEAYDNEGCINKSSGLHGLGGCVGRALDGRFLVICLENIIPYAGEFVADDPLRRFDLIKPRLPNGECPPWFLGFAVNMINVDNTNLFCLTASGYGLRETLFYKLFSRLQVYRTRAEMLHALPCISDGALSLDGGMIRSTGAFFLGNREDVDVKFPKPSVTSTLCENYIEVERQVKEMKGKKEKMLEDMKREEALLQAAKFNFDKKNQEFLKFLAESSSNATQNCSAPTPPKELSMNKTSTPSSRNMAESTKKRSLDTIRFGSEAADLAYHERFQSRTLVIEGKISEFELEEPQFAFILHIFESRGWESLVLRQYYAYPKIVREFYANIHKIKMDPPSFETYVRGAKIVVNAKLLSKVAQIPLVPEPGYPFGNPELPSKDTMMTKFAPVDGPSWYEHENSVPLARFTPTMHLLAWIILQNVWPIDDQPTEVGVERAKFMFAMVDEVPIDFCTHAIVAMIEAFHDKTTSLPYAGLISRIVTREIIFIPEFERYQCSSSFAKYTVQESHAEVSLEPKWGLPQAHEDPAPSSGDVHQQNMAESTKKRSRNTIRFGSEAADLAYHERFQSRTLVIEGKISEFELEEPQFAFILHIFESRGWESLVLRQYYAYPKIVREFYANIHKIKMDPPSFETYVRGAEILVNAELLSKVAQTPLVPEPGYPFGNPELPSKDTMMTKFAPVDGPSWHEHENSVPLARFTPTMHLLARIILQNVWPIDDQPTEVGVERAKFMFAMVDEVPIDFCTHAIVAMTEAFHDKTTSLPYAGLISRIVMLEIISIPEFERYQCSSSFAKDTVQESHA